MAVCPTSTLHLKSKKSTGVGDNYVTGQAALMLFDGDAGIED